MSPAPGRQGDGGGVGLQRPLDVPLPVEFRQAAVDRLGAGGGVAGEVSRGWRRISSLTFSAVCSGTRATVEGIMAVLLFAAKSHKTL